MRMKMTIKKSESAWIQKNRFESQLMKSLTLRLSFPKKRLTRPRLYDISCTLLLGKI